MPITTALLGGESTFVLSGGGHIQHLVNPPGNRKARYQLLAGAGWTSLPLLPFIRQPTLILAGDDDPIIPLVNARLMHSMIPRNAFHIYQGGHLEMIANPKPIAIHVESFLAEPRGRDRHDY